MPINTKNTILSYDLPANFDIQKKEGDITSVSKAEAIAERVKELFNLRKFKLIAFALLTLPLAPIAWPIGYAMIWREAKNNVVEALANKRIGLLVNPNDKIVDKFLKPIQKTLAKIDSFAFKPRLTSKEQWDQHISKNIHTMKQLYKDSLENQELFSIYIKQLNPKLQSEEIAEIFASIERSSKAEKAPSHDYSQLYLPLFH